MVTACCEAVIIFFPMCTHSPFSLSCIAIESLDIPKILSQQGGEVTYPLPRVRSLEVHAKLNMATLLFAVEWIHLDEFSWLIT